MSIMDGSGALGNLKIIPVPIGTVEELRQQGIDPKDVASCHAPAPGVIRGCSIEKDCPFHLKRYGGFKGKGPKYVGYFLQTHEGYRKEDFCACYVFVHTLLARMRAGIAAREKGEAFEIIRIVAHEGEKIVTRVGGPVNPADKTPGAPYHYVTSTITVPKFPRPGDNERLTYDQELVARERERELAEADAEAKIFDGVRLAPPEQEGLKEVFPMKETPREVVKK